MADGTGGVWQGQYRFARLSGEFQDNQAALHSAIAALAAKRYRLRHGRWPEALDQLVPDFLVRVPLDPYADGGPVRLRRLADGVVIYSLGNNRRDDGGDIRRPSGGMTVGNSDIGIQLWESPQRQRPAPALLPGAPTPEDGGPP